MKVGISDSKQIKRQQGIKAKPAETEVKRPPQKKVVSESPKVAASTASIREDKKMKVKAKPSNVRKKADENKDEEESVRCSLILGPNKGRH